MILIANKNQALTQKLLADLKSRGANADAVELNGTDANTRLYAEGLAGFIVDEANCEIPARALIDLVNGLGRRVSVIVLRSTENMAKEGNTYAEHVTLLDVNHYNEILSTAVFCHTGIDDGVRQKLKTVPFYNQQIPVSLLNTFGGLGILTVDASGLNKISVDYGTEVYNAMKRVLHDVMISLWGGTGCLRERDIITRKSENSNTYYIFMDRSRETGSLPYPGALEKVADRISQGINNAMWKELFLPAKVRRIPDCVQTIPLIGVGYCGVLNNPCIDIHEIVEGGLDSSKAMAQAQLKRGRDRQRELMHTLIQADDLLTPHFQGVFHLQSISKDMVDKAKTDKSIECLKPSIYGFESLIRVNQPGVKEYSVEAGIDSQYLRPDVLFAIAKSTNVALELDQICMRRAGDAARELPGVLMVNILPRNLYHINLLLGHFDTNMKVMFEVSESEAINNIELMLRSRDHLVKHQMGIAADDFGKGYSSLDRIIKIKPDIIKFDRGMIQDIHLDKVKQAYVQGLVTAAKILNTTILAEGVENWDEAQVLKDMGIELIQGFLFHRPESLHSIKGQIYTEANLQEVDQPIVPKNHVA